VAPESLSKQLHGAPVGTVVDMIQMRPATICLMADGYKAEGEGREMKTDKDSMKDVVSHMKKAQRQILHLSFCVICHYGAETLKTNVLCLSTNSECKCLQAILCSRNR